MTNAQMTATDRQHFFTQRQGLFIKRELLIGSCQNFLQHGEALRLRSQFGIEFSAGGIQCLDHRDGPAIHLRVRALEYLAQQAAHLLRVLERARLRIAFANNFLKPPARQLLRPGRADRLPGAEQRRAQQQDSNSARHLDAHTMPFGKLAEQIESARWFRSHRHVC